MNMAMPQSSDVPSCLTLLIKNPKDEGENLLWKRISRLKMFQTTIKNYAATKDASFDTREVFAMETNWATTYFIKERTAYFEEFLKLFFELQNLFFLEFLSKSELLGANWLACPSSLLEIRTWLNKQYIRSMDIDDLTGTDYTNSKVLRLLEDNAIHRNRSSWQIVISNDYPYQLSEKLCFQLFFLKMCIDYAYQSKSIFERKIPKSLFSSCLLTLKQSFSCFPENTRVAYVRKDDRNVDHFVIFVPCVSCNIFLPSYLLFTPDNSIMSGCESEYLLIQSTVNTMKETKYPKTVIFGHKFIPTKFDIFMNSYMSKSIFFYKFPLMLPSLLISYGLKINEKRKKTKSENILEYEERCKNYKPANCSVSDRPIACKKDQKTSRFERLSDKLIVSIFGKKLEPNIPIIAEHNLKEYPQSQNSDIKDLPLVNTCFENMNICDKQNEILLSPSFVNTTLDSNDTLFEDESHCLNLEEKECIPCATFWENMSEKEKFMYLTDRDINCRINEKNVINEGNCMCKHESINEMVNSDNSPRNQIPFSATFIDMYQLNEQYNLFSAEILSIEKSQHYRSKLFKDFDYSNFFQTMKEFIRFDRDISFDNLNLDDSDIHQIINNSVSLLTVDSQNDTHFYAANSTSQLFDNDHYKEKFGILSNGLCETKTSTDSQNESSTTILSHSSDNFYNLEDQTFQYEKHNFSKSYCQNNNTSDFSTKKMFEEVESYKSDDWKESLKNVSKNFILDKINFLKYLDLQISKDNINKLMKCPTNSNSIAALLLEKSASETEENMIYNSGSSLKDLSSHPPAMFTKNLSIESSESMNVPIETLFSKLDFHLNVAKPISKEEQIKKQHGKCSCCGSQLHSLLSFFYSARYCEYTGMYYCNNCHSNLQRIIPGRVNYLWDFCEKPVCNAAAQFLDFVFSLPLYQLSDYWIQNLKAKCPLLHHVHVLRKQLIGLRNIILLQEACQFAKKEFLEVDLLRFEPHFRLEEDTYSLRNLLEIKQENDHSIGDSFKYMNSYVNYKSFMDSKFKQSYENEVSSHQYRDSNSSALSKHAIQQKSIISNASFYKYSSKSFASYKLRADIGHINERNFSSGYRTRRRHLFDRLLCVTHIWQYHIENCTNFCKRCGSVCSICNDPNILFPINYDSYHKCEDCGSIQHVQCALMSAKCPICFSKCSNYVLSRRNTSF